jgi:general secretion pathway protein I
MIEVVVAFMLLSLALGVLLGGLTVGLRNTDRAAQAGLALLYAESLMAQTGVRVPLVPGESTGRTESGFSWKRQISRLTGTGPAALPSYSVSISVTPPDNGAPVQLVTLMLSDRPYTEQNRP